MSGRKATGKVAYHLIYRGKTHTRSEHNITLSMSILKSAKGEHVRGLTTAEHQQAETVKPQATEKVALVFMFLKATCLTF